MSIPWIERELREWPGVRHRYEMRGKHKSVVLSYGGVERFYIFACTLSDNRRGQKNLISDIRKMLRNMGAQRIERRRTIRPSYKRAQPKMAISPSVKPVKFHGRLARDPWAPLKGLL